MLLLDYIVPFLLAVGVLVFFHELGHYLVARAFNVKILTFKIGIGKTLFSRRFGRDQTEWAVGVLPLGGFVRMVDEREGTVAPQDLPRAFTQQNVYRRFAIVAAGPLANFLLAVMFYWGIFVGGMDEFRARIAAPPAQTLASQAGFEAGDLITGVDDETVRSWDDLNWILVKKIVKGQPVHLAIETQEGRQRERVLDVSSLRLDERDSSPLRQAGLILWRPKMSPVLSEISENRPAHQAGLRAGDRVLSIDGVPVDSVEGMIQTISRSAGRSLNVQVEGAEGGRRTLGVTPVAESDGNGQTVGRIGIKVSTEVSEEQREQWREYMYVHVNYGPVESLTRALKKTWDSAVLTLRMMGRMVLGQISWKSVSGPITIADYAGKAAKLGVAHYVNLMAAISIGLGVLNLLPVPVLDGGHLLYYLFEIVRGKPLPEQLIEYGQKIGVGLILALMMLAIFNDFSRLFPG